MLAARRILESFKNPWVLGFSTFGAAYGLYNYIDMTQSGTSYSLDVDLTGKTYIVTGATSGIGLKTTEELAKRHAMVIMACRNREKCIEKRRDVTLATKNKQIYCRQLDLSNFESIKSFVDKIDQEKFKLERIDGIIHNAGVMDEQKVVRQSGFENMLVTNYLGPFLMTALLMPKLLAQPHPVRIVFVNSNVINKVKALDLDNLNSDKEEKKWDGYEVYKQTKLASALFALELAERLGKSNVSILMTDPGRTRSGLDKGREEKFFLSRWLLKLVGFFMGERRPEKAVRPIMYAIADPEMNGKTKLFIDRERTPQEWNSLCEDKSLRERLWLIAEKWTNYRETAKQLNQRV
ncbi:Oxidoreductase, short chain dehydrogenase/reductase family protein [Aphelenchoides bicaudatus]|nr:Oxidoreductase, short chain dehydrogenase/reductase family protein [Aphelenchoides bicaudatus]